MTVILTKATAFFLWGSSRTVTMATVWVLPFCALGVSCCVGRAGLPLGCTLHGLLQRTVPRVAWLCLGCALTRALLGRRCPVVPGSLSCPGCVSGPSAFSWFPVPWVVLAVSPDRRTSPWFRLSRPHWFKLSRSWQWRGHELWLLVLVSLPALDPVRSRLVRPGLEAAKDSFA